MQRLTEAGLTQDTPLQRARIVVYFDNSEHSSRLDGKEADEKRLEKLRDLRQDMWSDPISFGGGDFRGWEVNLVENTREPADEEWEKEYFLQVDLEAEKLIHGLDAGDVFALAAYTAGFFRADMDDVYCETVAVGLSIPTFTIGEIDGGFSMKVESVPEGAAWQCRIAPLEDDLEDVSVITSRGAASGMDCLCKAKPGTEYRVQLRSVDPMNYSKHGEWSAIQSIVAGELPKHNAAQGEK